MKVRLKIDAEKCSGCRLCEMACSIYHLGVVNTCRSAIRVLKDDLKTGACQPMVCRQCKKMLCMDDDQSDADAYRSRFVWKSSFSTSCPFDALGLWKDEVYHCDLCDGDPRCVNLCSTGAIRILDNCGKNDEGRTTKDD